MSVVRSFGVVLAALLLLGACSSEPTDSAQPSPTSVPEALAFVEEEPPSLAFAEDLDTLVIEAGLWTEVESNEDLANCIREASGSNAQSVERLRTDVEAIGEGGWLIIADCLTGA